MVSDLEARLQHLEAENKRLSDLIGDVNAQTPSLEEPPPLASRVFDIEQDINELQINEYAIVTILRAVIACAVQLSPELEQKLRAAFAEMDTVFHTESEDVPLGSHSHHILMQTFRRLAGSLVPDTSNVA